MAKITKKSPIPIPKQLELFPEEDCWTSVRDAIPPQMAGACSTSNDVLISDGHCISFGYLDYTDLDLDDISSEEGQMLVRASWTDSAKELCTNISGRPRVMYWMHLPPSPKGQK